MKWSVVYEGAFNDDGSLYFPEKISKEFLENTRKTMGPYLFSNQYLNITIPDEEQDFKKEWIRHYDVLPSERYTFIFIDPAISLEDGADYTATTVVHTTWDETWYVEQAIRKRINAADTIKWIIGLNEVYKPMRIGIEQVAYQKALIDFLHEEMIRTNKIIPITGVKRSVLTQDGKRADNSKGFRIRSLIPRFEFGKILLNQGLDDFLREYHSFPRGGHDDLLDSLASISEIAVYPDKPKEQDHVTHPHDPRYEAHFIRRLVKQANQKDRGNDYDRDFDFEAGDESDYG